MIEHDGELRLALRRIAEIRLQLEADGNVEKLKVLAGAVQISADTCRAAHNWLSQEIEERNVLYE